MEEGALSVVSNCEFGRDGVKQICHVQFISRFRPVWIFVELMDSLIIWISGFRIQKGHAIKSYVVKLEDQWTSRQ